MTPNLINEIQQNLKHVKARHSSVMDLYEETGLSSIGECCNYQDSVNILKEIFSSQDVKPKSTDRELLLETHFRPDNITGIPDWFVSPEVRPIETILSLEKEGRIEILGMHKMGFLVNVKDVSLIEKKIYIYDNDRIELKWDGGKFSPSGYRGKIFKELFNNRAIVGEKQRPGKSVTLKKLKGFAPPLVTDTKIRQVLTRFRKVFRQNDLPFELPFGKDKSYKLIENNDGSYEIKS